MAATTNNHHDQEGRPAPRRKRKRRPTWVTVLIRIGQVLGTMLLIGVTTGAILACFAAMYIQTAIMPNVDLDLADITLGLTSTMYYTDTETGERVEYITLSGDQNRVWVSYDEIPDDLIKATVAIEDKRFYKHSGVDWIRTAKGVINMFTGGRIEGGSTITQQLIKNLTQNDEVTVRRKITEIFSALEFDKNYSKEETLEWYLNYIYLGQRCSGVYTASYTYFGKHVSELSLAECACLIAITNNPSMYDPYLNLEANRDRGGLVLWNMWDQGMISEEEYEAALDEVEVFVPVRGVDNKVETVTYTWYQDLAINQIIDDLMETYHWSEDMATYVLYNGGLQIDLCMNKEVQDIVDQVYGNLENLPYISASGQQMQSGITIIDNETGNVAAVAGGMGEKTSSRGWSRASDTLRPPGSSIKPLSVYAPALEMGLITPYTVVDDVPYKMEGTTAWPVNSYGYFRGRMTVADALEVSSNPVAVRVLGDYVTLESSYDFLETKFGISSLVWERNGDSDLNLAPLALGGLTTGVSTYEMAAAFATFPRMGKYIEPRTYTRVTDSEGRVLLENEEESSFILKESTAYYMNTMLTDVVSGSSGTGGAARFGNMAIAGKTGTTTSRRDRWFVGYTPYYTAAVWCGYDIQEPMTNSGNPPAVMWRLVMEQIHAELEYRDFDTPAEEEQVTAEYCMDSGMIPTEACALDLRGSRVARGTYVKGDEPGQYCTFHQQVEVCSESPVEGEEGLFHQAGPYCPEESVTTIGMLVYPRNYLDGSFTARDDKYFFTYLTGLENGGLCTVHTEAPIPEFDPMNPATWPLDDPNFNISDPTTWPGYVPPEGGTPEGGGSDIPGGIPIDTPDAGGDDETDTGSDEPPSNEDVPYAPAGGE